MRTKTIEEFYSLAHQYTMDLDNKYSFLTCICNAVFFALLAPIAYAGIVLLLLGINIKICAIIMVYTIIYIFVYIRIDKMIQEYRAKSKIRCIANLALYCKELMESTNSEKASVIRKAAKDANIPENEIFGG